MGVVALALACFPSKHSVWTLVGFALAAGFPVAPLFGVGPPPWIDWWQLGLAMGVVVSAIAAPGGRAGTAFGLLTVSAFFPQHAPPAGPLGLAGIAAGLILRDVYAPRRQALEECHV
jgi:hypothetical protein